MELSKPKPKTAGNSPSRQAKIKQMKAKLLIQFVKSRKALKHSELERLANIPSRSIGQWLKGRSLSDTNLIDLAAVLCDYGLKLDGWSFSLTFSGMVGKKPAPIKNEIIEHQGPDGSVYEYRVSEYRKTFNNKDFVKFLTKYDDNNLYEFYYQMVGGQYDFCEEEHWAPDLSQAYKKFIVRNSGNNLLSIRNVETSQTVWEQGDPEP